MSYYIQYTVQLVDSLFIISRTSGCLKLCKCIASIILKTIYRK